jgi:hypothetical protein
MKRSLAPALAVVLGSCTCGIDEGLVPPAPVPTPRVDPPPFDEALAPESAEATALERLGQPPFDEDLVAVVRTIATPEGGTMLVALRDPIDAAPVGELRELGTLAAGAPTTSARPARVREAAFTDAEPSEITGASAAWLVHDAGWCETEARRTLRVFFGTVRGRARPEIGSAFEAIEFAPCAGAEHASLAIGERELGCEDPAPLFRFEMPHELSAWPAAAEPAYASIPEVGVGVVREGAVDRVVVGPVAIGEPGSARCILRRGGARPAWLFVSSETGGPTLYRREAGEVQALGPTSRRWENVLPPDAPAEAREEDDEDDPPSLEELLRRSEAPEPEE